LQVQITNHNMPKNDLAFLSNKMGYIRNVMPVSITEDPALLHFSADAHALA